MKLKTVFFIVCFLVVMPHIGEAKLYTRNVSESLVVSDSVSVEKITGVPHPPHLEQDLTPIHDAVLAYITPNITTIFLLYFIISSIEIILRIPIKTPVKHQ
jgi:hypothetical protein